LIQQKKVLAVPTRARRRGVRDGATTFVAAVPAS
jgi:hypothetical protein